MSEHRTMETAESLLRDWLANVIAPLADGPRVHVSAVACDVCGPVEGLAGFTIAADIIRVLSRDVVHTAECMGYMRFATEPVAASLTPSTPDAQEGAL